MNESVWTDQQRRSYQWALAWAEEKLVAPAARQAFAVWFARRGRDLFVTPADAFTWWSAEQPQIEQED